MKKMFLNVLFFAICVLQSNLVEAQNPGFILAPNYSEDIGLSPIAPLPTNFSGNLNPNDPLDGYDGEPAKQAQNIQMDGNGEILFFIVDKYIYGKNGELIEYFKTSINESVGNDFNHVFNNEILVVPDNKDCNLFHLFFTAKNNNDDVDPYYTRLRVSYNSEGVLNTHSGFVSNNPEGCDDFMFPIEDLVPEFDELVNPYYSVGVVTNAFFAASYNEDGYFDVFISSFGFIFLLEVRDGNINYVTNVDIRETLFAVTVQENGIRQILTEMEVFRINSEVFKIALALDAVTQIQDEPFFYETNINIVTVSKTMGLDESNIQFLNYNNYDLNNGFNSANFISGIEFSKKGNKLFVSHAPYQESQATLDYWDITVPNPIKYELSSELEYGRGQIENVSYADDIMYIASDTHLARISNTLGSPVFDGSGSISNPNYSFSSPPPPDNFYGKYLLQDQIDDYNYDKIALTYDAFVYNTALNSLWKPNTLADSYNNNPLIYGFGSISYIEKELRVKAGTTLTIENMTLVFSPKARVVVENGENGQQGGKLILKNTTFTSDERCATNEFWLGVEVWGNQNTSQGSINNTSQGVLRMLGNSRIENAQIGVLLSQRKAVEVYSNVQPINCGYTINLEESIFENTFIDSRNGGIIQANSGAVFYNNHQGVFFRKHLSPNGANNVSFFTKITFTWDGPLKENAQPRNHIKMDQVKGINIRACAFNQETPELYSLSNQGYGINATLSQFYVNSQCDGLTTVGQPCPSYTPSTFTNLRFGIFAYFANSALSFSVNESEFNNCRYGIYSSRSEDARVTNNMFNVREETYQTAGCLFDFSDGYKIEGNSFQEQDNASIPNGQGNSYGVWINNSGVLHNEVYRNTFSNLKVGGQSDRRNAGEFTQSSPLSTGLVWTCNTFNSDIYQADLGVNGVIDYHQGILSLTSPSLQNSIQKSARNKFSIAPSTNSEHDIMVFNYPAPLNVYPNQQAISYIHLNDPFHIANDVDNLVVPQYAQYASSYISPTSNMCPSKLGSTSPIKKSKMEFHKSEIANLYAQIDGGNTSDLLNKATNFANENTTYQALMDASPYLSDEVLLAYIENSTISGKTKNVVVANSQLSPLVYQAVMQANLPNGVKNFITNAQDQVSERQLLYSEIKWNSDEYAYYFNDLTSELLLDTTELADYTPLINELNLLDDQLAKVQLLDVYVELRNATLSEEIRDDLDSLENPDYIELTIAIQELNDGLSNENELNENETLKNQFIDLRNNASCNMVSNSAKNILSCVFGVEDAPDFLPLQAGSNNAMLYSTNSEENTSERDYFEVKVAMYPNPSSGQVYFDLPDFEEGALQIQLFDVTGKEVYSVNYFNTNGELVDFTSLKKGTYIVRITLGNDYNESHLLQLND